MVNKTQNRKGQGLPLNTIVIAILVIIVLLVIIVFFTTRVGETGDQLDENSASACDPGNPAISTAYPDATNTDVNSRSECNNGEERVPGISTDEGVCCVAVSDDTDSNTDNEEEQNPSGPIPEDQR